ncbi:DUF3074 domain-containing protein [Mycena indigotica]|uniref:DUF3074 domain-containing protein n=1 Tax=Mycena indigotica TaxID=2126181 RepID=A0A8H6SBD1_9AGAR|nr:DUF3074 domain-containing protein [Mycena indigotica]KAF7294745.1 DUF3074 domain-containing protein [Mycena indigotica]
MKLTITPLKPSAIPGDDEIMLEAESLLDSITSWKAGKTYHHTVKTYSHPKGPDDGAPWHARVSVHKPEEATMLQMWDKLGKDKAVNEKEFIPDIAKVAKVKEVSATQTIWTLYYTFSPPIISPRVFTVVQITRLSESSPRSGLIVSIPVDLSGDEELAKLEEKGVRGRYVSVERLLELPDGTTEWRMATSSTPGGSIPSYFVEKSMDSKIAEDVPHFMKWLHSLRKARNRMRPLLLDRGHS